MKTKITFLIAAIGVLLASCVVHPPHRSSGKVPPGQAKKVYGTKSAKPFAPGQQKK